MKTELILLIFIVRAIRYSLSFGFTNGDVLLYLNGSYELTNTEGILQVFIYKWQHLEFPEGIWINICSESFNQPAASAACRQFGFIDSIDNGPYQNFGYKLNPNISAYVLTEALCPTVSNYVKYGDTHILRCSYYGDIINKSNVQCTPVAIKCDTRLLKDDPYNGQLMLSNRSGSYQYSVSSGYLNMYYNKEWIPVCANVSLFGSASACRQLGATSTSSTYPNRLVHTIGVYIGDPLCLVESYSCLNHCYNVTVFFLTQCNTVHVACTFLIKDGPQKSSGSLSRCQYQQLASSNSPTIGLSVSLSIFCIITFVLVISIILILYCVCYKSRRQEYNKIIEQNTKLI